jgi:hypothetical protein
MRLYGVPALPRSCLDRGGRSATTPLELEAMRGRAWHEHGVAVLPVEHIQDPWLRQAITNEANRRWGRRNGENHHGR